MLAELFALIKKHETMGDFTHTVVTEEMLNESEMKMGIKIPLEYRDFLKEFGHGGIGGIEILGVGKNGVILFEEKTLEYRTHGLPNELIVVENCDEWLYCINSANGKIVIWSVDSDGYSDAFDDFNSYLYSRVNDILENM